MIIRIQTTHQFLFSGLPRNAAESVRLDGSFENLQLFRFIAEVRALDALNALALDVPGITPVSQRICFPNAVLATLESSGETESSSAGTPS